jgi:thiol-disulfide isomerase/thioredoxin
MMFDRRTILAGMAGAAVAPSVATAADSPIARGALANNALALAFEAPSQDYLPGVQITGPSGDRNIADFKGRTLVMPIWAEWCPPCLAELGDFARLQRKHGNARFGIIPILSGTRKKMTPAVIKQLFEILHCDVFEPLMEYRLGAKLYNAMARKGRIIQLPCNLLVAPDGRVVARVFGLQTGEELEGGSALIRRAEAGHILSYWGQPAGDEFAAAMAGGFLT